MAIGIVERKVAIVTGAGRGIGRAIAIMLAEEGAKVVVNDIGAALDGSGGDAGPAQEVVNEIKKKGGQAIASTLSIGDPPNADKIVAATIETFGRVDILVNNAGILRDKIFHRMSWSDWSDVIGVHLHGSFSMSRACATHFREQNSGSMIHMTSTSGLIGNFGQANYMAAKMGIVGLSRGIALDMQRFNVRSNAIAPFAWGRMIGSIPTETDAEKERVERLQQMTPEKIAPLVVYLGSDKAAGISGQIFSVRNNEIFLFNQTAADPRDPSLRRLDAGEDRRAAQGRVRPVVHAARPLRRCVLLGPDLSVGRAHGHHLRQAARAENSRRRAHLHRQGHDALRARRRPRPRSDRSETSSISSTRRTSRRCRRFAAVLGYPGFWVRDLDTGIDWVRIVNGEQGCHPAPAAQARAARWSARAAYPRSDRQGRGQGRAGLYRAQGHRQGERRTDRDRRRRPRSAAPTAASAGRRARARRCTRFPSARPISSAISARGRSRR